MPIIIVPAKPTMYPAFWNAFGIANMPVPKDLKNESYALYSNTEFGINPKLRFITALMNEIHRVQCFYSAFYRLCIYCSLHFIASIFDLNCIHNFNSFHVNENTNSYIYLRYLLRVFYFEFSLNH